MSDPFLKAAELLEEVLSKSSDLDFSCQECGLPAELKQRIRKFLDDGA